MAEGRFLSKSIATSRKLKSVSLEADYLFARLIPHLDREGRVDGDPDILKAIACPLRAEMAHDVIARCLKELDAVGAIKWYEVAGQKVVWIPNFAEHQQGMRPERERPSKLPSQKVHAAKPAADSIEVSGVGREDSRNVADQVRTREVKLSEVKVSEVKGADSGESGPKGYGLLPKADCDQLYERWCGLLGSIPYPRFRKALLVVRSSGAGRTHSVADLDAAIEAYSEWHAEQDDREQRFLSLEKGFTDQIPKWVRYGQMPHVENGEMTERGRWAGSKALRAEAMAKRSA